VLLLVSFFLIKTIQIRTFWQVLGTKHNMNLAQISSVIFITTITILTSEGLNDVKPLAYHVIPVHCNIKLTAFLSNEFRNKSKKESKYVQFDDITGITINILHSTNSIKFDVLNIHVVHIDRQFVQLIETNGVVRYLSKVLHSSEKNVSITTFYFLELLSPGFYTLRINSSSFITEYDTGLFFGSDYLKRNNYLM